MSKITANKLTNKTISIVTPSFNQGEYLEETIKSVISQEGDFYIDYIIMDGGSTDNSVDIIKGYAERVNHDQWERKCLGIEMKWFSEKDFGQTDAINKGFKLARGNIVSWINSDDMFFPGSFSVVMDHFTHNPDDDFVFGDGDVIDGNGTLQWEWLSRPYDLKLLKSYHFLWNDFTNYIMQQATFWRRSVFDKIGLLDDSFHYAMDIEYWIRAGDKGLKLSHVPKKLGSFRMITGTKSLSSTTAFWPDSLEIFRRYKGAQNMQPFLTYYFFNIGLSRDFDEDYIQKEKLLMLKRWQQLQNKEKNILKKLSDKASIIACLKLANEAYLQHKRKTAFTLTRSVIRRNWIFILHPLNALLLLKFILGNKVSTALRKLKISLIQQYRYRKYLYRYTNNT